MSELLRDLNRIWGIDSRIKSQTGNEGIERDGPRLPITNRYFTISLQRHILKDDGRSRGVEFAVIAAGLIALGLFQTQVDSVRRIEIEQAAVMAEAAAAGQAPALGNEEERRRFEEKFNRLVSAMDAFQRQYNASGGKIWPKKEADALKKAIQALHLP